MGSKMLTTGSDTCDLIAHRRPLTNGDLQGYTRAEANSLPWSGWGMPTQAKAAQTVLMKGLQSAGFQKGLSQAL